MKGSIRLFTLLLIGGLVFSACQTQRVVTIPNAHAIAGAETLAQTTPVIVSTPPPATPPPVEVRTTEVPADVRTEAFRLDDAEQNADVMNQRYHVVVGSFRNRNNAVGLQQTLNREGNNAVIVVNKQGMFRVLIASYNTQSEARAKMQQVNRRFTDVWLLMQRQ